MPATTPNHFSSEKRARDAARDALLPAAHQQTSLLWDSFIRLMRVFLPIGAVILGLITILWPYLDDREVAFTLSTDDVAKGESSVHMTNMRYVGTNADNRIFKVRAASGFQDSPNAPRVKLSDIRAEMEIEGAGLATVTARTGIYRLEQSTLSLVGGVHMITSSGYALDMAGAEVNLKTHMATGQGSITGRSRLGSLAAARVTINADEEEGIFEGGVKLRIMPRKPNGAK
jgi:lipopolysaccharide export system protein LptC